MTEKRKAGRPPKPEGEGKGSYVGFRVEDADRQRMEAAAEAAGLKLSDWCREKLTKAAKREPR